MIPTWVSQPFMRGGGTPLPLLAPYRDDFTSVSGLLNGRTVPGLATYNVELETVPGGTTKNVLSVTTTGVGTVSGTSAAGKAHGYPVPLTARSYAEVRILASASLETNVIAEGVSLTCLPIKASNNVNMTIVPVVAGAAGTTHTIGTEIPQGGDIIGYDLKTPDGTDYAEPRLNGRIVGVASGGFIAATCTASIAGNTMTVTAIASGSLAVGQTLISGGFLGDHKITQQLTGSAGGTGTYTIDGPAGTVASGTIKTSWQAISLAASGITANGRHAIKGDATANSIDSFLLGEPSTMARLRLINPCRVQGKNSDGTLSYSGSFEYTGRDPTALNYRIRLASNNSVVASGAISTFTLDATTKTGTYTLPAFTPATILTQYWHEVYRTDAVDANGNAAEIGGQSPYIIGGLVVIGNGESIATKAYSATTTTTWPTVTKTWSADASNNGPALTRSNAPRTTFNNAITAFLSQFQAAAGNPGITFIKGGAGGTAHGSRSPGAGDNGAYANIKSTLLLQGGKANLALDIGGYTGTDGTVAGLVSYYSDLQNTYNDLGLTATGSVFIVPLGGAFGSSDTNQEMLRRFQAFEMPTMDSRYRLAAHYSDIPHDTTSGTDPLHLSLDGFGELFRRCGLAVANWIDPAGHPNDRTGPKLQSATRIDAQTIDVTVALNGFTGLSLSPGVGTNGTTDQWNGGLRFGTAVGADAVIKTYGGLAVNMIQTEVWPTGCTITSVGATTAVVRYTFAANTFPGTAYVGGPYGSNPYNRTNNATVNASYTSLASMLLGTISGESGVAVQNYWASNRNDFVQAA